MITTQKLRKSFCVGLLFFTSFSSSAMAQNLIETSQWSYFADTVMGGISKGNAGIEMKGTNKTIRSQGHVSTANNGGFIQVRTLISEKLIKQKVGIKLKVKGNGQEYFLHIRTSNTRLPWHYYQQGFDTTNSWSEVKLPFETFSKSSALLRSTLNPELIKTIGIVAYGKDHLADVSVIELEFY
jgi:hypothetical protein